MSNLVFVSGDFCSGSTLLFTLFRKSDRYYCLYEPLHEYVPESLLWDQRPKAHDHHFHVESYYREFKGFAQTRTLHQRRWGASGLYLPPEAEADDLYRYISYLVGSAFGRAPRVMFKENRLTFRLGWVRAKFPSAKIVHIHRPKEDQWKSIVRRVQAHHGREDVGQDKVDFTGFNIATWCEDLKGIYPELDAKNYTNGFDRFSALWRLSYEANRRYADISIDYRDLIGDFEATARRLWHCLGVTDVDTAALAQYVVRPAEMPKQAVESGVSALAARALDRVGRKYARARVRLENYLLGRRRS